MKNLFESKIIGIEKGLELQEKNQQEQIQQIRESIDRITAMKGRYEEWRMAAEGEGDNESALLYETEILEADVIICDLEMKILETEIKMDERWRKYYDHLMKVDLKKDSSELLENIDFELELISDYIAFLLEEENQSDENRQKLQELQKRKEALETERLKFIKG